MNKYKEMLIKINDYLDEGRNVATGSQAHFDIQYLLGIEKQDKPTQVFTSFFEEFEFGKFEDKTLLEVIESNKAYVHWCLNNNVIEIHGNIEDRFNRKMGE